MASIAQAGLITSFLAAIQASLSVLLVILYGGIAAHYKLLDSTTTKSISKICVKMFLPALLLTQIGSELHSSSAHRYLVILIWAFIYHLVSFLIGIAAHLVFGMPDWITAAIMFNNTTSYPLLLIQSLDETGILAQLIQGDEGSKAAIERAKSYFLVFATVSSCLTFAVGPRLIDSEHAPDEAGEDGKDPLSDEDEERDAGAGELDAVNREDDSTERTGLLAPTSTGPTANRRISVAPTTFFPSRPTENTPPAYDRRPALITQRRWIKLNDRARWWLLFLYDFLNAPLLGAVLGAVIGLIPSLHRAFFNDTNDGGIFSAWLTQSLKTIGSVFVPLPVVVAGVSLYLSTKRSKPDDDSSPTAAASTPWLTTAFILLIRFLVWPVVSIGTIYLLASRTQLVGRDPMLWFTMMLMPTGPPAMKLITMIQVSDADEADEQKVAKLLTISYIISPILAFTVVGSLRASQAAIGT